MSRIIPKLLNKGDLIGIVAPATSLTAIAEENIQIGIKNIESMGVSVKFSDNIRIRLQDPLSAMKRAQDIHNMFLDDSVACVMSLVGGYSSLELVDWLDFDLIRTHPKAFIGFSDITVLNIALRERANLLNFYGPTFAIFCQKKLPEYTKMHFLRMLAGYEKILIEDAPFYADDLWYEDNNGKRIWKKNPGRRVIRQNKFEGECIGGNLDTILALAGTAFWPNFEGKILFLEEGNDPSEEEVRRKIMQLKLAGVFDKIKGLIFGRFWRWSDQSAKKNSRLFFDFVFQTILKEYDFGVVVDVDFGHSDPMITIPVGGIITFDGKDIWLSK